MAFVKATKEKAKLRLAISGASGSGKTFTALTIASHFGKVAVLDAENRSSAKYSNVFDFDIDSTEGVNHPERFIKAIEEAESAGYDVIILETLTHAWEATKKEVDKKKQADKYGNGFTAWSVGTDLWNKLLNRIEQSSIHVICTMRAKVAYTQEKDQTGKTIIKKQGLEPEVRDGTEYFFDAVVDMDNEHIGRITKTRCAELDGYSCLKPSAELAETLLAWINEGSDPKPRVPATPAKPKASPEESKKLINDILDYAKQIGMSDEVITDILGHDDWESMDGKQYNKLKAEIMKLEKLLKNEVAK